MAFNFKIFLFSNLLLILLAIGVNVVSAQNIVTGTIKHIDGPLMTVEEASGSVVELKVSLSTVVEGEGVMGYGDLTSGQVVTIDVVKSRRGDALIAKKINVVKAKM